MLKIRDELKDRLAAIRAFADSVGLRHQLEQKLIYLDRYGAETKPCYECGGRGARYIFIETDCDGKPIGIANKPARSFMEVRTLEEWREVAERWGCQLYSCVPCRGTGAVIVERRALTELHYDRHEHCLGFSVTFYKVDNETGGKVLEARPFLVGGLIHHAEQGWGTHT